jgi:hypothetical protein
MITQPAINKPELNAPNIKYFNPASADPSQFLFHAANIYNDNDIVSIDKYIIIKSLEETKKNIPKILNKIRIKYSKSKDLSLDINNNNNPLIIITPLIIVLNVSTYKIPPEIEIEAESKDDNIGIIIINAKIKVKEDKERRFLLKEIRPSNLEKRTPQVSKDKIANPIKISNASQYILIKPSILIRIKEP